MFLEHVCVATDGSELAVQAAQIGALLARSGAGRMFAVSVAQPHFCWPNSSVPMPEAKFVRVHEAAQAHVETVLRIAHAAGVSCAAATPLSSSPGPELVRIAEEQGCDLIVMGTHGLSDSNRRFAGSVAQYVLANSTVPVLMLRVPREAWQADFTDRP